MRNFSVIKQADGTSVLFYRTRVSEMGLGVASHHDGRFWPTVTIHYGPKGLERFLGFIKLAEEPEKSCRLVLQDKGSAVHAVVVFSFQATLEQITRFLPKTVRESLAKASRPDSQIRIVMSAEYNAPREDVDPFREVFDRQKYFELSVGKQEGCVVTIFWSAVVPSFSEKLPES